MLYLFFLFVNFKIINWFSIIIWRWAIPIYKSIIMNSDLGIFDEFQTIVITLIIEAQIVLWPLGASSSWLLGNFDRILVVLSNCLAVWYYKMLQVHLVHFLPQTWDQPFLRKSWFLLVRNDISRPQSGC